MEVLVRCWSDGDVVIRRLDCETQYAVLIRRFDTSYPTGGYGVSDIEADATVDEAAVDRDVEDGIDAGIDIEVDVGVDVEDE
ncbi:hypothetical protein Tco_0281168 [Tanacetum coccineum]